MGREIKFRVWDNDREVMITEDDEIVINFCAGKCSVHYEREKNIVRDDIEMDVPVWDECDDFELMQSTGLPDKNNNPIYEGDIYHQGDKNILYVVVWHDTGLIGKQNKSSSYAGIEHWRDKIEVIGNIFQYPELINP